MNAVPRQNDRRAPGYAHGLDFAQKRPVSDDPASRRNPLRRSSTHVLDFLKNRGRRPGRLELEETGFSFLGFPGPCRGRHRHLCPTSGRVTKGLALPPPSPRAEIYAGSDMRS